MKKVLLAAAVSTGLVSPAFAATDGQLGATSTGDLKVTLEVKDLYRISGLTDMSISETNVNVADKSFVGVRNFCVYANNTGGTYKIKAGGGSGADPFALTSSGGASVSYEVYFKQSRDTTTNYSGNPNLTPNNFQNATGAANTVNALQCSAESDKNATIWVRIPNALDLTADTYTGTLALQIAAQ